jgi:hypothetical protein
MVSFTRHVVTTFSAFSFTMLLLDRILTYIVNHISNTSYHLQYWYCQVVYVFGAKPNLITCIGYIFLSAVKSLTLFCSSIFEHLSYLSKTSGIWKRLWIYSLQGDLAGNSKSKQDSCFYACKCLKASESQHTELRQALFFP